MLRLRGGRSISVGLVLVTIGLAHAGEAALPAPPGTLPGNARSAASAFTPVTPQNVARAKADLAAAVRQLETFLKGGGAAKVSGWKRYLLWDDLTALLAQDGPPNAATVASLDAKLTADQTGLEKPYFTRVRKALQAYANTATAAANAKLQEEYNQRMEKLAANLEAYEKNPASGDDAIAIGQTLGWLARSSQAESLRNSIRETYQRPNVLGFASRRFAASAVEEDVDRVTPIRDNVLGTSVYGTGRMRGHATLALEENPRAASYNIVLGGHVVSSNVGYNGPVTIYSTGFTTLSAHKHLLMTAAGLSGNPTAAHCRTNTNIYDICARCGLIERMAWKRAGQQKGAAEVEASAHAAGRIAGEMDARASRLIADQNDSYLNKFRYPLVRRGSFPDDLTFSSHRDRVEVVLTQVGDGQIAAPVAAPQHEGDHDLAVRAHESAVVNFGEALLGGVTLTDEQLVKIISEDLKAEVPEELKITPDKDPWSITFANEVPVRAQFANQGTKMAIRAKGFTRGEQRISEPIEIFATYTVEKAGGGSKLTRQGEVEVNFLLRERLSASQVAFKTFIRRKFEALFKPEITSDGLQLKGRMAKAGKLRLTELKSDAAWLTLGWEMPTAPAGAE
jgi:hypothetical protein